MQHFFIADCDSVFDGKRLRDLWSLPRLCIDLRYLSRLGTYRSRVERFFQTSANLENALAKIFWLRGCCRPVSFNAQAFDFVVFCLFKKRSRMVPADHCIFAAAGLRLFWRQFSGATVLSVFGKARLSWNGDCHFRNGRCDHERYPDRRIQLGIHWLDCGELFGSKRQLRRVRRSDLFQAKKSGREYLFISVS